MAKGKRGRKRSSGQRTANGKRLSRAKAAVAEQFPERGGNGQAQRRADRFRPFAGSSSIGLEMTCAGRLLLVGAFDGLDAAPDAIFNALQEYGRGYWSNFHGPGFVVSDYLREVKGPSNTGEIRPDPAGTWFDAIDNALRDAGHNARRAVHSVTVDLHWFPDDDAPWASRVINSRILQKRAELLRAKRPLPEGFEIAGELACDSDWAMLELLKDGAEALARGAVARKMAA
jgi:hypothetical protein